MEVIKTKKQAKEFCKWVAKQGDPFTYFDGNIFVSGGWGGSTTITPVEGGFEEFSQGENWLDPSPTFFTTKEEIERVWLDREWINDQIRLNENG